MNSSDHVRIVISYLSGTQSMLKMCLSQIDKHDAGHPFSIEIVSNSKCENELEPIFNEFEDRIDMAFHGCEDSEFWGSSEHRMLLDASFNHHYYDEGFMLTLDSDCFPIRSNWLKDMADMINNGADCSGILWPWSPPSDELAPETIEYKVRTHQNWNNTHVACQLIRYSKLRELGAYFSDGFDTNYEIPAKIHETGGKISGFMPTCCPIPESEFDPEMNRSVCVVFGDTMYHHGGASRETQGAVIDGGSVYDSTRERIEKEGPEWILEEGHRYTFEDEEAVHHYKMIGVYEMMTRFLLTNDRLFDS